tara:strand:- start:126 stop:350 length:225 start_codon:yes stop_codon:yes gene_type:complete
MKEIIEIIKQVAKQNEKKIPLITISKKSHLRDDIGFDSFDLALLTVLIEEKFEVDIFEDEIIKTVGEIIEKLEL